jgi:hypothetical protein
MKFIFALLTLALVLPTHAQASNSVTTERIYLTHRQAPMAAFHNGVPNSIGQGSLVFKRLTRTGHKIVEKTCFSTAGQNLIKFRQGRGIIFSTYTQSYRSVGPREASELKQSLKIIKAALKNDADDKSLVEDYENLAYEISDLEISDKEATSNALLDIRRILQELCD